MDIRACLIIAVMLSSADYCHGAVAAAGSSWLKNSNIMAWQLNPQLYIVGAAPKCTTSVAKLSPLQNAMCTTGYMDHISSVNVGLLIALKECRFQFKANKWNCTGPTLESMLEGVTDIRASKEDAFLHAVSSAGIAHAVSRGCRNGLISKCSCSEKDRPKTLDHDWVWGGCGDNIDYGYEFASAFVDLREEESNYPKGSEELAVMLMNKHNNGAGRRLVQKGDKIACKCHGVSGSCTLKTCWQELSPFRDIGDRLKSNYDTAMMVSFNKAGTGLRNTLRTRRSKRRASKEDLIYLKPLPDVCSMRIGNVTSDLLTVGRQCNPSSVGEDNCDSLCCNRGYETKTLLTTVKCKCKFKWCCYVQCEECSQEVEQSLCL